MNVKTQTTQWQERTAKQTAERPVCVHNMGRDTKGNPAICAGL
jgi:hypothetical protein